MKDNLIHHLELISQLKALDGSNRFSVGAYEKASKIIRDADDNFDFNNPEAIDGIGVKIARDIQSFVRTGVERCEICGSIRRHKATIKDIDIIAATKVTKIK